MPSFTAYLPSLIPSFESAAPPSRVLTERQSGGAAQSGARKLERQRRKLADYFSRLERADGRQSNPASTRAFIQARMDLDDKRQQLETARASAQRDPLQVKALKNEKKQLKAEVQKLYIEGPQGLSAEAMRMKRKQQWKAASIEGLHTMFGARIFSALGGIAGAEAAGMADKAAIRQGLGYGPQSMLSGMFRIVTEVPQIRLNRGGKPKMPPNLAADSNFKHNRKAMAAALTALNGAALGLRTAMADARGSPLPDKLHVVEERLDAIARAVAELVKFEKSYDNLCILLERECRGKKFSAGVSVVAGMMSMGASAVDPSGTAALVGHKLLCLGGFLLQAPLSAFDYMDGNVDFPQKISAKKIDLASLVKPESRSKKPEELGDDDIDVRAAVLLFEEQPQLVRGVVRSIYTYELAELNSERRKLQQHPATSEKNQQRLARVEKKFQELQRQVVLFEQHRHDELDPDGVIGKALLHGPYFCRKGAAAGIFNKVGEFWAQVNQRISNNFNPLASIGLVAAASDIAGACIGPHILQDAVASWQGNGPENAGAEHAAIGLMAAQATGAINSGVTVGPARFNKTVHDRKDLAAPAYISRGKAIESADRHVQLEEALRNGVISKGKKNRLEQALATIAAADTPTPADPQKLATATARWEKFQALKETVARTAEEINAEWRFTPKDDQGQPLLDAKGKPIVIDARSTSACHREYMPALERAWVPVKGIPRSIMKSLTFWKDVIRAKQANDSGNNMVRNGKMIDSDLNDAIAEAESFLREHRDVQSAHVPDSAAQPVDSEGAGLASAVIAGTSSPDRIEEIGLDQAESRPPA